MTYILLLIIGFQPVWTVHTRAQRLVYSIEELWKLVESRYYAYI